MNKKRILLYGDSNTHGYRGSDNGRFPYKERWTTIAGEIAGEGFELINKGLNGRTACRQEPLFPFRNGLAYIESCVEANFPVDMVCVMLGTNDLKKEFGMTAKHIAEDCVKVLSKAREAVQRLSSDSQCRFLLMSPIHMSMDVMRSKWADDYLGEQTVLISEKLGECLRQAAMREGFLFFDAALYADPCKEDGIHISPEGHCALGKAFGEYLLQIQSEGII